MRKYITFGIDYNDAILNSTKRRHVISFLNKPSYGIWGSSQIDGYYDYNSYWSEWCTCEEFNTYKLQYGFTFEVDSSAKILEINHPDDIKPYLVENSNMLTFMSDMLNRFCYLIDFNKIEAEYDGIHVNYYNTMEFRNSVFRSWDVESIVIWNSNVIKNVQPFTQSI